MRAAAAVLLALAAPAAQGPPAFRADVELVTVPLTVTHRDRNRPVGELTAADFRVFEDGVEQDVSLLDHERLPLSLCIVLDVSNSMTVQRTRLARAAINATLAGLLDDDEAAVIGFAGLVNVVVPWTPARSIEPMRWHEWGQGDSTALFDALQTALQAIDEASNPRPVILLVSDGGENTSAISLRQIVTTRRQSETLVYAFRPREPVSTVPPDIAVWSRERDYLPELVGESGGLILEMRTTQVAEEAASRFLDELDEQYTLGYVPKKPPDGKYRKLKVEARNKDLRVRHRGGYLAMPRDSGPGL